SAAKNAREEDRHPHRRQDQEDNDRHCSSTYLPLFLATLIQRSRKTVDGRTAQLPLRQCSPNRARPPRDVEFYYPMNRHARGSFARVVSTLYIGRFPVVQTAGRRGLSRRATPASPRRSAARYPNGRQSSPTAP